MTQARFGLRPTAPVTLQLLVSSPRDGSASLPVQVDVEPASARVMQRDFYVAPTPFIREELVEIPATMPPPPTMRQPSVNAEPVVRPSERQLRRPTATPTFSTPAISASARVASSRTNLPLFEHSPPPVYPHRAIQNGWEGILELRVTLRVDGAVGSVDVVTSSGYPVLDAAAVAAIRSWRAEPLTTRTVRRFVLPIRFRLPR